MKKQIMAMCLFLFTVQSFANEACAEYKHSRSDLWFESHEEACRDYMTYIQSSYQNFTLAYKRSGPNTCVYVVNSRGSENGTTLWSRECEKNKCTKVAGKVTKLSVPAGWAHLDSTGEVRDFKPSGPAPDQVCKGGCQYLLMSNEVVPGSTVYAPKINNGGYHPVFTQYTYAGTDTQCQAETDLTTPSTPPPPPEKPFACPTGKCPGVANGQQVCVPCGSTPDQGEGDGDDKGKDKEPGDSSGNNNGSDKGDKDGNKDGSSDGTPGVNGNGSGNGAGSGTGNGNGTGNGKGSGGGSDSGAKSDSTGKRPGESDGKDEDGDNTPPAFGERPGLYEPKYKNGIKGVWDQKKSQLQNSGLGRLSKRLMPTVNSGTCPRWDVDLNFGRNMNFGTKNVAPPCTIWPILRAMVMVCALILARKLVFGG